MVEKGNLWLWIGIGGTVAAVAVTAMLLKDCDEYTITDYPLASGTEDFLTSGIDITNCEQVILDVLDATTDDNVWYYGANHTCGDLLKINDSGTAAIEETGFENKVYEILFKGSEEGTCKFNIEYGVEADNDPQSVVEFDIRATPADE